ncbi:MAG: hypothetical protein ABSF26_10005 [Thermoguttaceae bacterium]
MGSRWYGIAVVMLWLAAMGWLVVRKVLPPLLVGDPPTYETILKTDRPQPPLGWTLLFNGQRIGWAVSTVTRQRNPADAQPNQTTEIRSLVHFSRIPIERWFLPFRRSLAGPGGQRPGHLEVEVESTVLIDPLDRLAEFDSSLRVQPTQSLVRIQGSVEGAKLKLSIHAGEFSYDSELPLRSESMLSDSFAPQTRLPGLRLGQHWTISSYSPMAIISNPVGLVQSRSPIEILQARVEGFELLPWHGHKERVWLVVYRTEAAGELADDKNVRNRLWVRPDGTILRQEVMMGAYTLSFLRMPDDEAAALANSPRPAAPAMHGAPR